MDCPLRERLSDPLLTALTLLLSILLFVMGPLQAAGVVTKFHFGASFGLILIPAAFLVSASMLAVGAILVAVALIITAAILELPQSATADLYLDVAAWLIAGLVFSAVVGRAVFGPGKVTYHRIVGAIFLYLDIGLIFVALFGFVALLVPNAFTNLAPLSGDFADKLIYFSFGTITTTGYGDIVAVHPYARSLANVEAIIGSLYPATLLARLVTLANKQDC
jgi:hypothetical protein